MLLFVSQQDVYCEVLVVAVVITSFYDEPKLESNWLSSTAAVGRFGRLGLDLRLMFLLF